MHLMVAQLLCIWYNVSISCRTEVNVKMMPVLLAGLSLAAFSALTARAQAPQPDSSVVTMTPGPHLYGPGNPATLVATDKGSEPVNIIIALDLTGVPDIAKEEKLAWGQYSLKPGVPVTTTLGEGLHYHLWACPAPYWPFDPSKGHQPLSTSSDSAVQCSKQEPVPSAKL